MKWYYFTIQKLLPKMLACIFKKLMHLLFKTCRLEVAGIENLNETKASVPCILALWHKRLAIIPEILKEVASGYTYAALVSKSRDGEILSTIVETYSQAKAIRVSHSARFAGLKEAILELTKEGRILVITPDGPKGPIHKIKPGLAAMQKLSKAAVIPISWKASKSFILPTWDKMEIPKPFATIKVVFGPAIFQDESFQEKDLQEALMTTEIFQ